MFGSLKCLIRDIGNEMWKERHKRNGTLPETVSLSSAAGSQRRGQCIVTTLTNFLWAARILHPLRPSCERERGFHFGEFFSVLMHGYFIMVLAHTGFYAAEITLGYASIAKDSSLTTLKNVIYNSRYGIMVFKSSALLVYYRIRSGDICDISKHIACELNQGLKATKRKVTVITGLLIAGLLIVSLMWEVMDFCTWEMGYWATFQVRV